MRSSSNDAFRPGAKADHNQNRSRKRHDADDIRTGLGLFKLWPLRADFKLTHYQNPLPASADDGSTEAIVSPLPPEEWYMLRRTHPNVLLTGAQVAVNIALAALESSLQQPVVTWRTGDPLVWPTLPSSGTLPGDAPHRRFARLEGFRRAQVSVASAVTIWTSIGSTSFREKSESLITSICSLLCTLTARRQMPRRIGPSLAAHSRQISNRTGNPTEEWR